MTLRVRLRGYQGSVKKTATVSSNDPQNSRGLLVLQGRVKALIEVQPSGNIAFRGLADQIEEKTINLVSTNRQFAIQKVESNLEDKIRYQMETVEAGKHYRLKVANLLKQGTYNGFIKCTTDLSEKPDIQIRVNGYIEGEVSVKPLMILVGKLGAQQPVRTGKVFVTNNRKKPFQIKNLTYDDKLIDVKQEALPDGTGYSLEIVPKQDSLSTVAGGRQTTSLKIETDIPNDESRQVQIHIMNSSDTPPAGATGPQAPPKPPDAAKGPKQ